MGELQGLLGYTFKDESLLRLALTHPSVLHETGKALHTNQRLEFLGDAVLQLILSDALYARYTNFTEGALTKARARLVNGSSLADHARRIELGAHLVVSRGEEMHGGRDRPSALADTFEAVLGAIFLDGGYEEARSFVLREFRNDLSDLKMSQGIENPKGELQELLQASSAEPPLYEIISATGPDHDRSFECVVRHLGRALASGQGKSKKEAESAAALAALMSLRAATEVPGMSQG